ncbi:receptor-like protein kinase ANXUR1 [Vigna unguiculata]|uniref:receptor-like protein kinase ANXUR1 n=1 Tax=Vigna unguiculata TaxID=3917 RepID=UPI001015CC68|nr:receptor-like protein kinase ANXUR1 [Vigna unguiculata]
MMILSHLGTFGHLSVEYVRDGTVTDKCDVYSFGVVLLQVMTGKIIYGKDKDHCLAKELLEKCVVEELIDPKIKGKIAAECWQVFIDIFLRCIKSEADERPTMGEVEVELERALLLQQQADLTNIDMDYTLLSKTIIIPKSERQINYFIGQKQEQESNTVT